MTIGAQEVLAVVGAATGIATAIFWGAFYMGRIHSRLAEHDERLDEIDHKFDRLALKP